MSNTNATERIALHIEPLDNLFFRGGRPMESGSRNRSELPGPQNLLGMIRTYVWGATGCDFSKLSTTLRQGGNLVDAARQNGVPDWAAKLEVRGPWLGQFARNGETATDLFLPLPANLEIGAQNSGAQHYWVLHPTQRKLPGWDQEGTTVLPLWNRSWAKERMKPPADASTKKAEYRLIRLEGLKKYLAGDTTIPVAPDPTSDPCFMLPKNLYALEAKVGIGLSLETGTVEKGLLFSTDLLRLNRKCCGGFYAEILTPRAAELRRLFESPVVLTFGGESRCVSVRSVKPLEWPASSSQKSQFFYLLSPGIFGAAAIPHSLTSNVGTVAAAVRDSFSVSGWDLARHGPKPARFGVSSGSVYFTQDPGRYEPLHSLCTDSEDRAAGYGAVLQGVWNYA